MRGFWRKFKGSYATRVGLSLLAFRMFTSVFTLGHTYVPWTSAGQKTGANASPVSRRKTKRGPVPRGYAGSRTFNWSMTTAYPYNLQQMEEAMEKPTTVTEAQLEKCVRYLDDLRESGATNMFGARPYLEEEFLGLRRQAGAILSYWMKTFSERHGRPA